MNDIAKSGNTRIINLSDVPTGDAIEASMLCETIKIKVHNLTASGPLTIPVRIDSPFNTAPIELLEEIARFGMATKMEFRAMMKICRILES